MLDVKKTLAKLLGAHTDAYITRTYTLGAVNNWYANNAINIGITGYTPISVTGQTNQASVHFANLSFTDTLLSVTRAQNSTSGSLSQNQATFVVRYIKNELVGGVVSKLLNTLKMLTSERGWAVC